LKNYFITIEGVEGVGKSTVLNYIVDYLQRHQIHYVMTREPGGTEIAEAIRELLLHQTYQEKMVVDTELLLMFASRAQHLACVIKPALALGKWVICDRFTDATYAYQGGGRGIDKRRIQILEKWVQADLRPDVTILLDAPVEVGMARMQRRGLKDRIEKEQIEFFRAVRKAYLDMAQADPQRYRVVDANVNIDQVQQQITKIFAKLLC